MLEYARWKYILALIVILVSALYALPNLYPQDPSVQIRPNRGGEVDNALKQRVTTALKAAGVTAKAVEIEDKNLLVRMTNSEGQEKAARALQTALRSEYVVARNLAPTMPDWLAAIRAKPMLLGLDLQGGVHFLMEVDRKAAIDKRFNAYLEDLRLTLRTNGLIYESVERDAPNSITVTLRPGSDVDKARGLIQENLNGAASDLGMMTALNAFEFEPIGNVIRIRVSDDVIRQMTLNAVEQNLSTLRNRINSLGVAEPILQRQGSERVVVQLPGIQDTAEAKRILGATATLEYRGVYDGGNAFEAATTGNVPPGARLYYQRELGPDGKPIPVLLNKRMIVSGEDMVDARATVDQNGQPAVSVTLNNAGGQRMLDFTTESVNKPMAVVFIERIPQVRIVDGKEVRSSIVKEEVISIASVREPFGKRFQTTGLAQLEANELSKLLKAGALAAPMDFIEERTVGPSLGKENVERGLQAVLFSFVFVLAFFVFYYRVFGLITNIALLLNLLMVVAVMSMLDATLTLPGLAGIALTVGMSVDANVLINERIREELRAGMPPQTAIATGYDRAAGTIADANITALLAGIALFAFGTGPIKGFAVSLIVGILTSMYTAVSVSRGVATLIYGRRKKLKTVAI
jgi:preprotein translocase subunit SecD